MYRLSLFGYPYWKALGHGRRFAIFVPFVFCHARYSPAHRIDPLFFWSIDLSSSGLMDVSSPILSMAGDNCDSYVYAYLLAAGRYVY